MQTRINSSTDWLLDSCYSRCFVCGTKMDPPLVDSRGRLKRRALYFYVVVDEYGFKEHTDERICDNCLVNGDLSQFGEGPDFK